MEFNKSDPLYYTNKESNGQILFNKGVSVFMLVITVMLIYFIYLIVNEGITDGGDIVGVVAIGIAAVVTGIGAFGVDYVTNHHKRFLREFQLHDDSIDERLTYPKQGKEETNRISFDQVDRIIVGSFTETSLSFIMKKLMQIYQPPKYFSLLVVGYQGKYFFKKISSQGEMDQWMDKFKQADVPCFYAANDLALAYLAYTEDIDVYFEEAADTLLPHAQESILVDKRKKGTERTTWVPVGLLNYWERKHKKVRFLIASLLFFLCMAMVYLEEYGFDDAAAAIVMGILLIPIFGLVCRKLAEWKDLVYIYMKTCLGGTIGVVLFNIILRDMDFSMILYPWLLVGIIAVFWIAFFLIARLIWYVLL